MHTQFGEDGLIEAFFQNHAPRNKCCFEVGAADGIFFSNTLRLRGEGWQVCLIEADEDQFAKLQEQDLTNVCAINAAVGVSHGVLIDDVLSFCQMPTDLDFGVIDIDGQDYWAWKDMEVYRPRLMLVEFADGAGTGFIPDRDGKGQATFDKILELGESKGYIPLAKTRVNLLFVDKVAL